MARQKATQVRLASRGSIWGAVGVVSPGARTASVPLCFSALMHRRSGACWPFLRKEPSPVDGLLMVCW